MTDPEPTLLLTRPKPQSEAFLVDCEARAGRRLPAVISPLIRIEQTGEVPKLDRYTTVIFTSANAVRRVLSSETLTGRIVKTVGERAASLARAAGAKAEALGEDVDAFILAASRVEAPALVCRGVHSRGDLAARLRDQGIPLDEVVLYDQVAQPLSPAARQLLSGEYPVVAPVFSPRTANLLYGQGAMTASLTVIAMSRAVADAWKGPGEVLVADRPNSTSMRALTLKQF